MSSVYAKRREQLLNWMQPDSVAVIFSATEKSRNADNDYPFRQNSSFYYLTGFNEPSSALVLLSSEKQFILFNRSHDPEKEIWTGRRVGQKGALELYGADEAFAIEEFNTRLPALLTNKKVLYYSLGLERQDDEKILNAIEHVRGQVRTGVTAPDMIHSLTTQLGEMRLFKDAFEIEQMQKSADIAAQAHIQAMQQCRAGMYEYELEAVMHAAFLKQGARSPAYPFIVGGGENGCILHYTENNALLNDGELVLIDAGAEYQSYASDITRTFPINGCFSNEQRAIYELVLNAQLAAIDIIKPGILWNTVHETAVAVLTQGLVELGLLQGDVAQLIEDKTYRRFYMHKTGHWLGFDVHDAGAYKIKAQWRELQVGMMLTVEPGLYIAAHSEGVDPKWWNIGVRIEDDVLVTAQGHRVLSHAVPKSIADIEKIMAV